MAIHAGDMLLADWGGKAAAVYVGVDDRYPMRQLCDRT